MDLSVDGGKATPVVLKDSQRDAVHGQTTHVDLLRVNLDVEINAVVPLELGGVEEAPGVKEGGVLEQITRELSVQALPTAIPESIAYEVGEMEIGDTILLSALTPPEGVTLLDDPEETVLATLSPPRLQTEAAEEIEAETELIGEEGEQAEDGEAAAEGSSARGVAAPATPLRRRWRSRRLADRRAGQPRARVRGQPAQRRFPRRRGAGRALGTRACEGPLPRPPRRGSRRCRGAGRRPRRARRPRVAVLCPQTYYNDAGSSVGPARGSFKLPLDRVLVVHDEIDLPFGEVRTRLGGGLAGNNGLKSIRGGLGSPDFMRVRVGVGRPDSTDPEIVAAYVLGRFRESGAEVAGLVDEAVAQVERAVLGELPESIGATRPGEDA